MKIGKNDMVSFIFVALLTVMIFGSLFSVLLPWISEIYPNEAGAQIIKFLIFLALEIGFIFVAARRMTREEEKRIGQSDNEENNKQKGVIGDRIFDLKRVGKVIDYIFHMLPFYFPLLILRLDLFWGFKAILIGYAMIAYLMVELQNLVFSILKIADFVSDKLKIENGLARVLLKTLSLVIFFPLAFYLGYRLVIFYINLSS